MPASLPASMPWRGMRRASVVGSAVGRERVVGRRRVAMRRKGCMVAEVSWRQVCLILLFWFSDLDVRLVVCGQGMVFMGI